MKYKSTHPIFAIPRNRFHFFYASAPRLLAAVLVVLTGLSFLFLQLPTRQWFSDYWEHASAIRALSENILSPMNPHYATMDSDRQFIPHHVFLGLLIQHLKISVFTALGLSAIFTTVSFFFFFFGFVRAYFNNVKAPLIGILIFLFAWGTPWIWPGFYELRAFLHVNYYPAAFVFSLTFGCWWILIRSIRSQSIGLLPVFALPSLMAIMFVTHQLGAMFAFGGAMLFLLFEPQFKIKIRLILTVLLCMGLAMTWFWPYFNPIDLTLHASSDKSNEGHADFYRTWPVLMMMGPALLGIPVIVRMIVIRKQLAIAFGFVGVFGGYVVGGLLENPIAHRLLSYSIVFLHLAILSQILSFVDSQKAESFPKKYRRQILGLIAFFIVIQSAFAIGDFLKIGYEAIKGESFGAYPSQNIIPNLTEVATLIPHDAIIFASDDPAISITALTGKVIARPRPQLMIQDGAARTYDNKAFFALSTSNTERKRLIQKYHAGYILIKKEDVDENAQKDIQNLGSILMQNNILVLIKVGAAPIP